MNKNEKLVYENERGQTIEFSTVSLFFVTNVDGIDGLKNTIYTSKSMNQDGDTCVGSTLESRNIVVSGSIRKDKENNRAKLLSILNPKLDGKITYINKNMEKSIKCKIEKAPTISQDRLPNFVVSFICNNPYWTDILENKEEIALWKGDFSFELEISQDTGIEMGHREPSLIVNVLNEGDVECGMKVEFKALATVVNPSILNVNTQEYIKINKTMTAGEIIIVTTGFGNKKVESYLNGVPTNAFNYIDFQSTFLQLDVGDNLFRYNAEENIDNLEVSIYYTPQYLGV